MPGAALAAMSWATVGGLAGAVCVLLLLVVLLSEGKLLGKPLLRLIYTLLAPVFAANDRAQRWLDVCGLLDLRTARSLLDIGCGGGGLLACALSAADRLEATGVDWSPAMARRVGARLARFGRSQMVVADVSRGLPFSDGSFDRLVSFGVLPGLRNWRFVLEEMHRVLAPGGRLVLGGGNAVLWPLNEQQAIEAAVRLGLEMQRRAHIARHGEVWVFERM